MPMLDGVPSSFDAAPSRVQDRIILEALLLSPPLIPIFLSEMGRRIHKATVNVIFKELRIEDEQAALSRSALHAILVNPSRYGDAVRTIHVIDHASTPLHGCFSPLSDPQFDSPSESHSMDSPTCRLRPISTKELQEVLKSVPLLEQFIWSSSVCPPDGICEILHTHNPRLSRFEYSPVTSRVANQNAVPRWDALSLPLLASQHALSTLKVSRLSHAGAQSLAQFMSELDEESMLEEVSIDTNWMDEALCELLGRACSKARRLEIGSDGIRFNDKCLLTLLPLCENLTEFTLGNVQGKLSKELWRKMASYPPLQKIRVNISEGLVQHSWSIDHLSSLHDFPFGHLTHLSVKRIFAPMIYRVHQVASMQPVPPAFAQAVASATTLEKLECDWWSWKPDTLRLPLEQCKLLQTLTVAFDGPFSKLFAMTLPFSAATSLRTLSVFIPEEYFPALSSSPVLSIRQSVSRSPSVSPVQRSRPLPSPLDISESHSEEHTFSVQLAQLNETGIPLREIRKFVKRCSSIRDIIWYGKRGTKAHWTITYPAHTSNPLIIILPPTSTPDSLEHSMQENWTSSTINSINREGSIWEGALAEKYKSKYAEMNRREENATKAEKANRANSRKSPSSQRPSISPIIITPTKGKSTKQNQSSSPGSPLNYQRSPASSPENYLMSHLQRRPAGQVILPLLTGELQEENPGLGVKLED
ncbi:SubName: Full=Uncharacterized protein {ECO:0000313/EMBL:CCA67586.1} [Serendipita indica DSM 11827]|uniref:Uncharacterized protein n=1 Tax=Serendipita indica (strain DSM 11827) TaxID=1109443 RepID=G4T8F5_SERID|nr:SubName: Full=Uncharacterized protein {ECO:0000313/EMBL:CCA67586.1} [Serendipita indica DSM 11827]CCA67586.1 hypothetical protein PIIN_01414 [Serendipita indica DSM 11827]